MGLNKVKGNMYDWVTHTHTHLGGECPHKCPYCYVNNSRFPVEKYIGALRLCEKEFAIPYGIGKTIFIEHMNDLFAERVPMPWIKQILQHCSKYPKNTYVFQTKNPGRVIFYTNNLPPNVIIGTTMETNRETVGLAPSPFMRYFGIKRLRKAGFDVFVTVEPIIDFDEDNFAKALINIRPKFVAIGADSKGCGLQEPSEEKILLLLHDLTKAGIQLRVKDNLIRLVPRPALLHYMKT